MSCRGTVLGNAGCAELFHCCTGAWDILYCKLENLKFNPNKSANYGLESLYSKPRCERNLEGESGQQHLEGRESWHNVQKSNTKSRTLIVRATFVDLRFLICKFFFFNRSCWLFFSQQCASVAILESTVYICSFCKLFIRLTNFTIFIKNRFYGAIHTFKNYFVTVFSVWVILTSALRALVKNPVKESFYRKKKNN